MIVQTVSTLWDKIVAVDLGDDEKNRRAHLFNVQMMISILITLLLAAFFLLMKPLGLLRSPLLWVITGYPLALIPVSLYCLFQSRRGRVQSSVVLYVSVDSLAILLAVCLFNGIHSPAWSLYIWTISIAGALLAPAYALWMTIGVVASFVVMLILEQMGYYSPPFVFEPEVLEYGQIVCLSLMMSFSVGLLTYLNMRSLREAFNHLHREIAERERVESEREQLIGELRESLANVKTLRGLLPICSACKRIRDDQGYWSQVEEYLHVHSEARLTHGMCPECMAKWYPEYTKK